jgi:heme/copper-type cytochrome/quinol oxidase subunit 2
VIPVLAVLLLAGTGSMPVAQEEPAAPAAEAPAAEQAPAAEEAPVKFIKLYVQEWKWTPSEIRVPLGTKVRIEAFSYDSSRRFDLKAYKLKVALPQDEPVTFEFVADKAGKFRWKCGRPCGNGCAKLTGTLIVE